MKEIKSKKKRKEIAPVINMSQAPPSNNSTKSSRRKMIKEYSPFGGLEIEGGFNLNFNPRLAGKKVTSIPEKQVSITNIADLGMQSFQSKNTEKFAKNSKNQAMYNKKLIP
jgi:hypothetical protein